MGLIMGLTGQVGASKDFVRDILVELKGFKVFSLQDVLKDEVVRRGLEVTRENSHEVWVDLMDRFGSAVLAKRAVELLGDEEFIIIDSIRSSEEAQFFRDNNVDFLLIGITAPQRFRYERLRRLARENGRDLSFADFIELDERDAGSEDSEYGIGVVNTFKLCDFIIKSDCSDEELKAKIKGILNSLEE